LIVPEPDRPSQQLLRRRQQSWIPEDVVQPRLDPPRAKRMKQHRVGVARFIAVILVPQLSPIVARLDEIRQFGAESFNLRLIEEPNTGQKPVSVKLLDLSRTDLKDLPFNR
jgi:hypothetical protein